MFGAIIGDIVGSSREWEARKSTDFELFPAGSSFTDDSVMTVATASAILTGEDFATTYRRFGRQYPGRGYGGHFACWLANYSQGPYGSFGNGSGMRVSPVSWAFNNQNDVLAWAQRSAECTHNHPEGIKGAQAIALAGYLARQDDASMDDIKIAIATTFGYDLYRTVEEIRPFYSFDVTCQGSVPEAIIAFLESDSYESAIRLAVSLGGDADTQACMAGGLAEAFYGGVPTDIADKAWALLDDNMRGIISQFYTKYGMSLNMKV